MPTGTDTAQRDYRWVMPLGWWTRRGHYFWYMVREFTSLPLALWLLWLLVEIRRAQDGPAGYHPHSSPAFVIFSVVVLLFALYHSVTFLRLSGAAMHVVVADRSIPSRLIVPAGFALWAAASLVIAFALIYLGR